MYITIFNVIDISVGCLLPEFSLPHDFSALLDKPF